MTKTGPNPLQIITGRARLAGIIGWPVAHSLSPLLHNYWLRQYGIDGAYVPLPVEPKNLGAVLRALPPMGWRGVNLTIPHKEAALSWLDRIDDAAREIGAVNTIVINEDGAIEGRNTDAYGFIAHLKDSLTAWQPAGVAMILGAGGAARAVVAALLREGVTNIRLVNRNMTRAQALAADFGPAVEPLGWNDLPMAMGDISLLVNSTSLGMQGQESLSIDLTPLPPTAVVYDLVYAPLETDLLRQARARDLRAIDGLGMLLHQARPAFQAWFGIDPAVTPALRDYILSARG